MKLNCTEDMSSEYNMDGWDLGYLVMSKTRGIVKYIVISPLWQDCWNNKFMSPSVVVEVKCDKSKACLPE